MTARIATPDLRERIVAGGEFALLDVRESGPFACGHILTASNLPLSRLELGIEALVPRKATFVALTDGGEGLAWRAAAVLDAMGYGNLAFHEGGAPSWQAAGGELFEGTNVPSKAFGEIVEIALGTPVLDAEEVRRRVEAGDDIIILDGRPWDEYRDFNIPGGISCPNSELPLHIRDLVGSEAITVVVNCAGRTRSIIGAQTLRNTDLPNPVYSLENGTIGWEWAGYPLERGASRRYCDATKKALSWSREQCERMAWRTGVGTIDGATLEAWRGDQTTTLHLFDVRSPEEHAAGTLPGWLMIEGTQLVQETDSWVAVRDARIVLADDCGTRSRVTGHWLRQMGYPNVHVLDTDMSPPRVRPPSRQAPGAPLVSPRHVLDNDFAIVDLSSSERFIERHPDGAFWGLRSRLEDVIHGLPNERPVALVDDREGHLAALAAVDLARLGIDARVVEGGLAAWVAAGLPVASGRDGALCTMDDQGAAPFELFDGPEAATRRYIAWETGLPEQIERDGLLQFRPSNITAVPREK